MTGIESTGFPAVAQARWFQDWEETRIDDSDPTELTRRALTTRATEALVNLSLGLRRDLRLEVVGHFEALCLRGANAEQCVKAICIAPLRDEARLKECLTADVRHRLPLATQWIERLLGLQPVLSRLVDHWLSLPVRYFESLGASPADIWLKLYETGLIVPLAEATTRFDFNAIWLRFFERDVVAVRRVAMTRISQALTQDLFPTTSLQAESRSADSGSYSAGHERQGGSTDLLSGSDRHARAIKEIAAIESAVNQGRDSKAQRYVEQLISRQLATEEGPEFAVKSLCNIAQKAADSFRPDFERKCLERALELDASDPWLTIQCADHEKRARRYASAMQYLARALPTQERFVKTCIADVLKEQGDLREARAAYQSIAGWDDNPLIVTALADLSRMEGDFMSARCGYERALSLEPGGSRTRAGLATLEKTQANYETAIHILEQLLGDAGLSKKDRAVYRYSLADCHSLAGNLQNALRELDIILRESPFMAEARLKRCATLGALARYDEARRGLESARTQDADQGRVSLVRGLIFLAAGQPGEASRLLRQENLFGGALEEGEMSVRCLAVAHARLVTAESDAESFGMSWLQ